MDDIFIKKINFMTAKNALVFDKPDDFTAFDGLTFDYTGGRGPYDLIFSFVVSARDMEDSMEEVRAKGLLLPGGLLYMALPKGPFQRGRRLSGHRFYL